MIDREAKRKIEKLAFSLRQKIDTMDYQLNLIEDLIEKAEELEAEEEKTEKDEAGRIQDKRLYNKIRYINTKMLEKITLFGILEQEE